MEVDVEGGGERGREDEEEEEGGYGDADEGQLGLARRVEKSASFTARSVMPM
jgi:hypothetical protein